MKPPWYRLKVWYSFCLFDDQELSLLASFRETSIVALDGSTHYGADVTMTLILLLHHPLRSRLPIDGRLTTQKDVDH